MEWTTAEVARIAGVSSRTLRHYDAIGLLRPARVGTGGLRHYGWDELLRLQQILLLRRLGLPLDRVASVLDGQTDRVLALRRHADELRAERERLDVLARTVARTIAQIEGGDAMSAEEMFEGFAARRAEMEDALAQRHGDGVREHFRTAERRTEGWTADDYAAVQREWEGIHRRLADLMAAGVRPDAPEVLAVVDEHHRSVARFWTPNRESYRGLADLYAEHPEFRERLEAVAPGLVAFLAAAMGAYADARLA
ncbi:TipAS antibiotic-recognition domain-containing protein [Patulibacter sp. SYSU D01012]|uniref:MerR family transcriptional regulator n=1 Tax=Patulibacter sp. SYSU D01012 TaxID=2817381 RepID=UPI001B304E69|nr:TipAS antibiotic-recognition domain-containing protein [Patulibacter sp. SYSU D01012]